MRRTLQRTKMETIPKHAAREGGAASRQPEKAQVGDECKDVLNSALHLYKALDRENTDKNATQVRTSRFQFRSQPSRSLTKMGVWRCKSRNARCTVEPNKFSGKPNRLVGMERERRGRKNVLQSFVTERKSSVPSAKQFSPRQSPNKIFDGRGYQGEDYSDRICHAIHLLYSLGFPHGESSKMLSRSAPSNAQ